MTKVIRRRQKKSGALSKFCLDGGTAKNLWQNKNMKVRRVDTTPHATHSRISLCLEISGLSVEATIRCCVRSAVGTHPCARRLLCRSPLGCGAAGIRALPFSAAARLESALYRCGHAGRMTLPRWRPVRPVGVPDGMSKIKRSFSERHYDTKTALNPQARIFRNFWRVGRWVWKQP